MPIERQDTTSEFVVILQTDAGQVVLNSEQVREFYFIEDILSFCVTGKLVFTDNNGIFEFGPLTGNERLGVIYGSSDKEWTFSVFKMSRIEKNSSTDESSSQTIQLFFVDTTFYNLNFLSFSRSWKDEKITDIVQDISTDMLGITKWDKKEKIKESMDFFYMPYWSPNLALTWLLRRSTGTQSKQPGFCFYNNSKGTSLVTLDTLLSQTKLMTLGDRDDGKYVFTDSSLILFNKILGWSLSGIDTIAIKRLSGDTSMGYNTLSKSFLIEEHTYSKSLKNHTVLGKYSLFPDHSNEKSVFTHTMEDTAKKMNTLFNNQWIKLYDQQQTLSITVRGHEERFCGGMIEIIWPSADALTTKYNKSLSGKYLIKSITHYFSGYNKPAYAQKMVLIKNGCENSDARFLMKSTKRNMAT